MSNLYDLITTDEKGTKKTLLKSATLKSIREVYRGKVQLILSDKKNQINQWIRN